MRVTVFVIILYVCQTAFSCSNDDDIVVVAAYGWLFLLEFDGVEVAAAGHRRRDGGSDDGSRSGRVAIMRCSR